MTPSHWHIFCSVIDNFGDIGTTWRLAQQLTHEYQQQVTLFVDELNALASLVPEADTAAIYQTLHDIQVQYWTSEFPDTPPAPIVIEAFACTLPANYRQAMVKSDSLCINLEYFTAEDWAEGCHGLASLQADGLKKFFFFPGISTSTGGLLREQNLIAQRNAFCQQVEQQRFWCQQWQIPTPQPNSIKLFLFGYENRALSQLIEQLSQFPQRIEAYLPEGKLRNSLLAHNPNEPPTTGQTQSFGNLRLHLIPFLPQAEFDRLLWLCDLNFVRGEESLTRAIWAGKPFIWHIYPTDDGAHWDKLNAFIHTYPIIEPLASLNQQWNQEQLDENILTNCLNQLELLTKQAQQQSNKLVAQHDLCQQLITFVKSKL